MQVLPIARVVDQQDNTKTEPSIPPGMGAIGWWLYADNLGMHYATPMRSAALKGEWKASMTWTYEAAEVRAWLKRNK